MATPSNFTLYGNTSGGPPVEYTWTRNGAVITNNDSYSISLRFNNPLSGTTIGLLSNALYRSTLIVTGVLPGVYQYSVNNRATPTSMDRDFNIEGNNNYDALKPHLNCVRLCIVFSCIIIISPQEGK